MLAKLQPEIPRGEGWTYEPKWDGFRTIVTVGDEGVDLESRGDRPMGRYFPDIVAMLEARNTGALVADGELVLVRPDGLSFGELQMRLHPAASRVAKLAADIPATLILFDLLEEAGEDLRGHSLSERRSRLASLAERIGAEPTPERLGELPPGPDLRVTPGPTSSRSPNGGSPTRRGWGRTASWRSGSTSPISPACAAGSR